MIEAFFSTMTSVEVSAMLDQAGIANGRLNEPIDVWNHVQFSARDKWREIQTEAGPVRALLPPFTFTDQEAVMGDVPSVGQHTDEVLHEIGLSSRKNRRNASGRRDMTEFDPATHRMVPEQRWFEDFRLGERFLLPSRTMTEAVFLAFQAASGDNHPIHYDVEFCKARSMPGLLAHGLQSLIQTAPGAGLFPYMVEDSLVGFIEQSSRFLKPVFAGDTVYPALEIDELTPNRTTGVLGFKSTIHNQRRELVLDGRQRYLLRRRPA